MASRSIYITEEQLAELKDIKVSVQEIFRQGYIIETLLQGSNPSINNDFNKNKISKLMQFHQEQIEGLMRTIDFHREQINKLKGGTNYAIHNKKNQNHKLA